MRRLPHLAVASTLTIALAACGAGGGEEEADATGSADLTLWLMEDSVPDAAQEWLVEEFESTHEGSTLTVQMQPWAGIVELLQTSLPDSSQTPDLVEIGNTQASTFTSVGAFSPVDEILEDLGGDSLIESGLEAGTWEGTTYAPPLYAGSRIIFYRQDLLDAAGIEVPTTLDELNEAAVELNEANPEDTDDFSGIYLASSDPKTLEGWLFTYGGDYATQQSDGTWEGALSTPESLEGLRAAQELMEDGSEYVSDPNEAVPVAYELFNSGRIGFYSGLALKEYDIDDELWESGQAQVMALPGPDPETPGTTFAGGSNVAISAASENQELSEEVLKLIYSPDFQTLLAEEAGWVPGNLDYADALSGHSADPFQDAVAHSQLTPNTPSWGVADSAQLPLEIWTRIADGEDVEDVAADVDAQLEEILND
ncbi:MULTISPECIES: extracellular solute-binding protein [Nesterenkonia]|uniref:N,N'-diacetylchitobiose transport system substrate-binding protein n=1 Tax=Nesterenkonia xinjiangensis TaxID=225327 RepID=A0A7Z0GLB7_9MICC|nr:MULTISPECIES: extracellular solute-binding protein [Nesterenkonia]MDZ5078271.1 extracellular solute-binding protein [Nesterenkonia sp. HG001]NYJ78116.1 N,N'-diacetylchitobiose transport system substrate-binding protein [Nesterenkonia xinjiangensis]